VQGISPKYERRVVYGPFFRRLSDTQDATAALKQILSGEVWGEIPRWGISPTVEAIPGMLPDDVSGIEFWSFQEPDRPVGPRSHWSQEGPFVTIDKTEEMAKLSVVFARISQDLAK
jgi:hypothetical protein